MCCAWAGTLPRVTRTATVPVATKQRRKMAHGVSLELTREYGADWRQRQTAVSDLVKLFITWSPRWKRYPRVARSLGRVAGTGAGHPGLGNSRQRHRYVLMD